VWRPDEETIAWVMSNIDELAVGRGMIDQLRVRMPELASVDPALLGEAAVECAMFAGLNLVRRAKGRTMTAYRLLSSAPVSDRPSPPVPYLSADEAVDLMPRIIEGIFGHYPYLSARGLDWLSRHDEAALHEAEAFVTGHADDVDPQLAGHDLAVYLCDWVVANSDVARWRFDPQERTCTVLLPNGDMLDPYRTVVTCLRDRQPVAHRFVEKARELGA
jgi:hypothetical protein